MGSLQDELQKQLEQAAVPKPEPKVVVNEVSVPKDRTSVEGWKLKEYAASISALCADLETSLNSLTTGLEQYRLLDPAESTLKPGRSLKDFKGSVKELLAKAVNARRIATSMKSELSGT